MIFKGATGMAFSSSCKLGMMSLLDELFMMFG